MKEDHGQQIPSEDQIQELPDYQDVLAAQKISFNDIKEHMTGPVVSFVAHVIILVFLGSMVVFEGTPERQQIEVEVQEVDVKELEKIPEPPQPEEMEEVEVEIDIERPDVVTEVNVQVEDVAVSATSTDISMPNVLSVKPTNSALVLPGIMAMRTGSARKQAIKQYGGSSRTEMAVLKALRWLRDHQNPDGSWGEAAMCKPAFTGWAILAFLAHGETPSSAEFGACVLKGIKKLVEYGDSPNPVAAGASGYGHMIFTYALGEAYAVTKIPMLEAVLNKNIALTVKGQNASGGYDYSYGQSGRNDTSVLGWASQALKAAFAAGATTPGIEQAIEKVCQNLKGPTKGSKGFVYSNSPGKPNGPGTPSMTAVGTLVLHLLGEGKSPEALDGLNYLLGNYNNFGWDVQQSWPLYTWYYQTQAYFQGFSGKGKEWRDWNKMFTTELLKNQNPDGHWNTPDKDRNRNIKQVEQGHGEGMFSELDTAVYGTCLSCLMLTVYYRYLPTFKVVDAHAAPALPAAAGDAGAAAAGKAKDDGGGLVIE